MQRVPDSSAAAGPPSVSRTGKLLGCVAVCCISASALGLAVHHGLQESATDLGRHSVRLAAANDRQEECIYKAIRSKLPKGAAIYVPNYAYGQEVRANDLATLWAVPQPSPATAQWVVSLVHGHECGGLRLKVRRR
jgi:hypothetical protein